MEKLTFWKIIPQSIFRFQDFLHKNLLKDDAQRCYKIYYKIIWYTILFYAMCVFP